MHNVLSVCVCHSLSSLPLFLNHKSHFSTVEKAMALPAIGQVLPPYSQSTPNGIPFFLCIPIYPLSCTWCCSQQAHSVVFPRGDPQLSVPSWPQQQDEVIGLEAPPNCVEDHSAVPSLWATSRPVQSHSRQDPILPFPRRQANRNGEAAHCARAFSAAEQAEVWACVDLCSCG